jgi:VIT1/CCC1 family predicted Fe2+/Mn2+ transporter
MLIEHHYLQRVGWLRAAVLGANDGIVSTASLLLGVAASGASEASIIVAGTAGLVAGAMSMAAGEYVSVSSQSDTERADREREKLELQLHPEAELEELTHIYQARGLDPGLARTVAVRLTEQDALGAHLRDELGMNHTTRARPLQAAVTSALSFAAGALVPLLLTIVVSRAQLNLVVAAGSLLALGLLGASGARLGGAKVLRATARVMFWGVGAMALTYLAGRLFGAAG